MAAGQSARLAKKEEDSDEEERLSAWWHIQTDEPGIGAEDNPHEAAGGVGDQAGVVATGSAASASPSSRSSSSSSNSRSMAAYLDCWNDRTCPSK